MMAAYKDPGELWWLEQEEKAANGTHGELTYAALYGFTIQPGDGESWRVLGWGNQVVAICPRWVGAVVVAHALARSYAGE